MLWAFCMYLDGNEAASDGMTAAPPRAICQGARAVGVIMRRFLTTLAAWPWPLPWTSANMHALVSDGTLPLDGAGGRHLSIWLPPPATTLEVCIGRHLATAFVVPLPVACTTRVWNMTQCVHGATQRAVLREAWCAAVAIATAGPTGDMQFVDFADELRALRCGPQAANGLARWPVYLTVALPFGAAHEWRGIVASRLMATLLPQLDACGFFCRPLCTDEPTYKILLWPMDAVWTTHAPLDLVLPMRDRLMPCLFVMLQTAYIALWGPNGGPPLVELLPSLDLQLCDQGA
jgi:hypothetical protein